MSGNLKRGAVSPEIGQIQLLLLKNGYGVEFRGQLIDSESDNGFGHYGARTEDKVRKFQRDVFSALTEEDKKTLLAEFKKQYGENAEFNFSVDGKAGKTTLFFLNFRLQSENRPSVTQTDAVKKIEELSAEADQQKSDLIADYTTLLNPQSDASLGEYLKPEFLPIGEKAEGGNINFFTAKSSTNEPMPFAYNANYFNFGENSSFHLNYGDNGEEQNHGFGARYKGLEFNHHSFISSDNELNITRLNAVIGDMKKEIRAGAALVNNEIAGYAGAAYSTDNGKVRTLTQMEIILGQTYQAMSGSFTANTENTSITARGMISKERKSIEAVLAHQITDKVGAQLTGRYHDVDGEKSWEAEPIASYQINEAFNAYTGATFRTDGWNGIIGLSTQITDKFNLSTEYRPDYVRGAPMTHNAVIMGSISF
jgi:hypothetical protein